MTCLFRKLLQAYQIDALQCIPQPDAILMRIRESILKITIRVERFQIPPFFPFCCFPFSFSFQILLFLII